MTAEPSAEALAAIHRAAFTMPRPWDAREIAGFLALSDVCTEHHASGFAMARVTLDEAELLTIAVHPAAQGAGLGRALLARVERAAHRKGAARIFLEVAASNGPARALYAGAGYAESGRRPGYYSAPDGSRVDALLMSKALNAQ